MSSLLFWPAFPPFRSLSLQTTSFGVTNLLYVGQQPVSLLACLSWCAASTYQYLQLPPISPGLHYTQFDMQSRSFFSGSGHCVERSPDLLLNHFCLEHDFRNIELVEQNVSCLESAPLEMLFCSLGAGWKGRYFFLAAPFQSGASSLKMDWVMLQIPQIPTVHTKVYSAFLNKFFSICHMPLGQFLTSQEVRVPFYFLFSVCSLLSLPISLSSFSISYHHVGYLNPFKNFFLFYVWC